MSNFVLIRALKHTLDGSDGGYGFIPPFTVIEYDEYKAKDLVNRGIFEFVNLPPTANYFSKVEQNIETKVITVEEVKAEEAETPKETKKGKNKK